MGRITDRTQAGRSAPGAVRALSAGCVLLFAVVAAYGAGPAGAQVDDARTPTLGSAMEGRVEGLGATAIGGFVGADYIRVFVTVTNSTSAAIDIEVPRGTLLATEDDFHQVAVVAGLVDEGELAHGVEPVITAEPGESEYALVAYCGQQGDMGPNELTPMFYAGQALDPLPAILHNLAADDADHHTAQEAVWWATDSPIYPPPLDLEGALDGVDAASFAQAPVQVVPDANYVPHWADRITFGGDEGGFAGANPRAIERGDSRSLLPLLLVLLVVGGLVVGLGVWSRSTRRPAVQPVASRTGWPMAQGGPGLGGPLAGWYRDPSGGPQLRWWDGTHWTDHRRNG